MEMTELKKWIQELLEEVEYLKEQLAEEKSENKIIMMINAKLTDENEQLKKEKEEKQND